MNKKIDPWKVKELSQRPTEAEIKSNMERAQMEIQVKAGYTLRVWDLLSLFKKHMKYGQTMTIYLKEPMTIEAIQERVHKAFGDL